MSKMKDIKYLITFLTFSLSSPSMTNLSSKSFIIAFRMEDLASSKHNFYTNLKYEETKNRNIKLYTL